APVDRAPVTARRDARRGECAGLPAQRGRESPLSGECAGLPAQRGRESPLSIDDPGCGAQRRGSAALGQLTIASHCATLWGMSAARAGILVALAVAGLGCARTFRAEAVQPNPMSAPTEISPISEKITIVTGDMELEQPYAAAPSERASVATNH